MSGEIILYTTEDGRAAIQLKAQDGSVWLTQAEIAELFEVTPQAITQHLRAIYDEGEWDESATCKPFLQVRTEGTRNVSRQISHYSLPMILAVGFRVRSPRGAQFRRWAAASLSDYLIKGFVMDDARLKDPEADYFEELLARIRDIRSSEKQFYKKVLDIYATSVDYDPSDDASQLFFQTVQNKIHWAAHGRRGRRRAGRRRQGPHGPHRLGQPAQGRAAAQGRCPHRQELSGRGRDRGPQPDRHRLFGVRRATGPGPQADDHGELDRKAG